ncbi:NHL repeat-containing protein [candidate division KSB1 bacterium]
MKRLLPLILMITITAAFNCTSAPETYTVEETGGIKYIHNISPKWGDAPKVDLGFVRKYGELESGNENLQLYRPMDVAVDSKGDIYILDSGNFRVQKFTSDGEFILSFGNKGQGPGELSAPFGMDTDENDNIYIADYTNQVIHVFDMNGNFVRGIKPGKGLMPKSLLFIDPEKIILNSQGLSDPEKLESEKLVKIINNSGEITGEFGERKQFEDEMLQFIGNEVFFALDGDNNIYISYMMQNRIEKYNSEGNMIWKMDRVKPYPESETSESKRGTSPDGRTYYVFKTNRFSLNIQSDHRDRIWVQSMERAYTDGEWERGGESDENIIIFEIYDKDGILLGELKKDFYTKGRLFRIIGDRFFVIDARDEHSVFEYRIIEK